MTCHTQITLGLSNFHVNFLFFSFSFFINCINSKQGSERIFCFFEMLLIKDNFL